MSNNQGMKAIQFRSLHAHSTGFLMPNPWDAGSARLLTGLGFKALATTSAGFSYAHGRPDHSVALAPLLAHLAEVAAATDLPVSADLENGFGPSAEAVAETIVLAAQAGIVGGSIEDYSGNKDQPLWDIAEAADRIRAAAQAARSLPFPFTLTARAENYLYGQPQLAQTIQRLQAYQDAGADVLFAPGITNPGDIQTLVQAVDRPVSVLISVPGMALSVQELWDLGVRRVSVGGSLARAAYSELLRAATELRDAGSCTYADQALAGAQLNRLFSAPV